MESGLDEEGYIKSIGAAQIQAQFEDLVEAVVAQLLRSFSAEELHSIYLYGSVATGGAQQGTSDLDVLVLFRQALTGETKETLADIEKATGEQFQHLVRDIGIAAASLYDVLSTGNQVGWGCFIKHMCSVVHGDDIGLLFGAFRPGKSVVYGLNDDLQAQVDQFNLQAEPDMRQMISLSRKLIRASFGLVVEQCDYWTTDLERCAASFCRCYPQKVEQMESVLLIARGKIDEHRACCQLLTEFGAWLSREFRANVEPFRQSLPLVSPEALT